MSLDIGTYGISNPAWSGVGIGTITGEGESAAQDIPTFWAPLNISLVPYAAVGSGTPTFTRATAASQTDFEGKQNLVLSGEARMQGARRVENLIPTDISTWNTKAAQMTLTPGVTDPLGGNTAFTATSEATNQYIAHTLTNASGIQVRNSIWVRRRTGTGTISMYDGSDGNGGLDVTGLLSASWNRIETPVRTAAGAGSNDIGFLAVASGDAIDIWQGQMEPVTGQPNQNPSEYVSVGVLSAPHHGAGVDGVKYFKTLNGNTVTNNVVTEATGAPIIAGQAGVAATAPVDASGPYGYLAEGARTNTAKQSNAFTTTWADIGTPASAQNAAAPDGTTTAWTLTDNDGAAYEGISQTTIAFTAGQTGVASLYVEKKASSPVYPGFYVYSNVTGTVISGLIIDEVAGTVVPIPTGGSYAAPLAYGIIDANTDYWRVWVSVTQAGANASTGLGMFPAISTDGATISVAGQGSTVFAWVQFELGTFPSSYIPTTTVAVTRNADVEQYVSAGNLPTNSFTIYGEVIWQEVQPAGSYFLFGSYVDASNYTAVLWDGTNLIARKRIAGVNTDATKALTPTANTCIKWAARFSSTSGIDIFHTGAIGTNNVTTTDCQIGTNFQVGADGNGAGQSYASESPIRIYPQALSTSKLQALTT